MYSLYSNLVGQLFSFALNELKQSSALLLNLLLEQAGLAFLQEQNVLRVGWVARRLPTTADGRPVERRLLFFLTNELVLFALLIIRYLVPGAYP